MPIRQNRQTVTLVFNSCHVIFSTTVTYVSKLPTVWRSGPGFEAKKRERVPTVITTLPTATYFYALHIEITYSLPCYFYTVDAQKSYILRSVLPLTYTPSRALYLKHEINKS